METPKCNFVITIGRQYGSGGREIGRLVADALGIKYYDKELLTEAAKASGVKPEIFEAADERSPSFFSNIWSFNLGFNSGSYLIGNSPVSDEKIYAAQSNVMKNLARQSSCVIVGRSADYVLREHPALISVFIHSSIEQRIIRIMNRTNIDSAEKAREIAAKKDKLRASYYNFYTDKTWGAASSYDLSIDSSKLSNDAISRLIVNYVKARIELL
ncbi:MAG: AAA family ATPase [Muribaculaceae bacterium]